MPKDGELNEFKFMWNRSIFNALQGNFAVHFFRALKDAVRQSRREYYFFLCSGNVLHFHFRRKLIVRTMPANAIVCMLGIHSSVLCLCGRHTTNRHTFDVRITPLIQNVGNSLIIYLFIGCPGMQCEYIVHNRAQPNSILFIQGKFRGRTK